LSDRLRDAGEVAVSQPSVYRVWKNAGRLDRWTRAPCKKGAGFDQPTHCMRTDAPTPYTDSIRPTRSGAAGIGGTAPDAAVRKAYWRCFFQRSEFSRTLRVCRE